MILHSVRRPFVVWRRHESTQAPYMMIEGTLLNIAAVIRHTVANIYSRWCESENEIGREKKKNT